MFPEASLTPDDVVDFRKPLQRGRLDVHAGAALHAIYNDGQLDRRCDRLVVLVQTFLRRLVVIRRDGENAIGAHRLDLGSEFDHLSGVVAARARQHRHAALGFFERDLHHAQMFLVRERGTFARRSARHQEVDAFFDLPLYQRSKRVLVERPVLAERGDHGGAATLK